MAKKPSKKRDHKEKKKSLKGITSGIATIKATFNNTIVTITDRQGNALRPHVPEDRNFADVNIRRSTHFALNQLG